jgi:hypothetical protein
VDGRDNGGAGHFDELRVNRTKMKDAAFEWDDAKADENYAKHGVDFESARHQIDLGAPRHKA